MENNRNCLNTVHTTYTCRCNDAMMQTADRSIHFMISNREAYMYVANTWKSKQLCTNFVLFNNKDIRLAKWRIQLCCS